MQKRSTHKFKFKKGNKRETTTKKNKTEITVDVFGQTTSSRKRELKREREVGDCWEESTLPAAVYDINRISSWAIMSSFLSPGQTDGSDAIVARSVMHKDKNFTNNRNKQCLHVRNTITHCIFLHTLKNSRYSVFK